MDDDFDYRDWERREEAADWNDIESGTDEQRAGALINRALSIGLYEQSTLNRVIGYVGTAVDINRKLQSFTQLYQSLKMLGEAYGRKQAWNDSLAAFNEAIEVAGNELQDDRLRANVMGWRAWVLFNMRNLLAAAESYANTALLNEIANPENAASDMNAAARSWLLANDYSQAIEACEKAIRLASDNYSLKDAVESHAMLALAYARLGDLEKAKFHQKKAKSQSEIAGVERGAEYAMARADAWIALLEGEYSKADELFKAQSTFQSNARQFNLASSSVFGRALCALAQGNEERAFELLESIYDSAEQMKMTIDLTEVASEFENHYIADENWFDALTLWQRTQNLLAAQEFDYEKSELCDARIAYFEAKLAGEPSDKAEKLVTLKTRMGDRFFMLYDSVFDLARALTATERASEALTLCDEALGYHRSRGEEGLGAVHLDAEWHEVRALAFQKLGDQQACDREAQLAFDLFFDEGLFDQAKRLREFKKQAGGAA